MHPLPPKPAESARALNAGLTFAVTVALFAWCGIWLDDQLGSKPWLTLFLTLVGVFGGGLHVVRELAPSAMGSWGNARPTAGKPSSKEPPTKTPDDPATRSDD